MAIPAAAPTFIPRTIAQQVAAAGETVGDDAAVNFGSQPRAVVDPGQRPGLLTLSYWFRYGDIQHLTLDQVRGAIDAGASSYPPGVIKCMRVSNLPLVDFIHCPPTSLSGIEEYQALQPVPIRQNIPVDRY
jgi:hypothetical protein